MKLFHSPTSPYVRKVLLAAHELGLAGRIELLPSAAHPINRDKEIIALNPLGQVPTFITDDGTVLADSRVICEYLDAMAKGGLFPAPGALRWQALTDQAMGDGLLGAALLARYETVVRPQDMQFPDWLDGQKSKMRDVVAYIEGRVGETGQRVDIGTITFACALSYLDLRFPDFGWRETAPKAALWYETFEKRPSMQATTLG